MPIKKMPLILLFKLSVFFNAFIEFSGGFPGRAEIIGNYFVFFREKNAQKNRA
jgi:hypothetical protein